MSQETSEECHEWKAICFVADSHSMVGMAKSANDSRMEEKKQSRKNGMEAWLEIEMNVEEINGLGLCTSASRNDFFGYFAGTPSTLATGALLRSFQARNGLYCFETCDVRSNE